MADRKVKVELELEIARAVRSSAELAAVMRGAKVTIEELGDEADDTSADMDQLAANTDVAKRSVDDLGDEALGTVADLAMLDAKIRATEMSVRKLSVALARGDESVAGQLDDERSMLGQLRRLRKELDDLGPGGGGGGGGGRGPIRLLRGIDFSQTVAEARGQLITALLGAVIVTSPAIGALISGAVAGTVAGGGIIGGIIAASRDPRVAAEWTRFTSLLTKEAFGSNAFVGPTRAAIQELESTFMDIDFGESLAKGAVAVDELSAGINGLVRNVMPGFDRMMGSSESIMEVFGDGLADTGDAVSDFLDDIRRSKGTLQGLQLLFDGVNGTIRVTGQLLNWLGNRWHDLVGFFAGSSGDLEDIASWVTRIGTFGMTDESWASQYFANWNDTFERWDKIGPIVENTSQVVRKGSERIVVGIDGVATSATSAANQLESLESALDDLIPGVFDLEESQDQAANAMARLNEQLEEQRAAGVEGAGALEGNTQAARDNREMVRDLVDQYAGLIVKTGGTREAAAELKEQLREQLIQMGLNETQVQYYVDQLDRIPTDKITALTVENQQAILAAQETERELNRLYDRTIHVTLYHDDVYREFREGERSSSGRPLDYTDQYWQLDGRRATGGPVLAGRWYGVNEQRMEYFKPAMDGWIAPLGQTAPGQTTNGAGPMVVENHIEIGGEVVRVVRTELSASNRDTRRRVQAGATR